MSFEHVVAAAQAASSKTLEPTVILDVGELIGITDFFVVTSGRNDRQVRAVVDEVVERVKGVGGGAPLRREGLNDASWVLLDYGDFLVHVFGEEARGFYDLERLWSDAATIEWDVEAVANPR